MLNLTEEKIGPCMLAVQVEVESDKVNGAMQQAARQIAQKVRIPGFRPGKAPYPVVLRTFGKDNVLAEAVETLGNQVLQELVTQRDLKLYNTPQLEIVEKEPLKLKYTLTTQPHVELGGYRSIRIEAKLPEVVSESEVEQNLEQMRKRHAVQLPVDRPAQMGDALRLDLKAETVEPAQVWFERKDVERELENGADDFAPGFSAAVVGMQMSETRQFALAIPSDYKMTDLAGKTLNVTVTVHDIREVQLPALDDELARTVGEYETLEALRTTLRENLTERNKETEESRFGSETLQTALNTAQFEYPDAMVDEEVNNRIKNLSDEVTQQGFQFEKWMATNQTNLANLRASFRVEAEQSIRQSLLLYKLAEREGVKVEASEIEEVAAEELSLYPSEMQEQMQKLYSSEAARLSISLRLVQQRTLDKLIAIAKGEGILLPSDATSSGQPSQILVASA